MDHLFSACIVIEKISTVYMNFKIQIEYTVVEGFHRQAYESNQNISFRTLNTIKVQIVAHSERIITRKIH